MEESAKNQLILDDPWVRELWEFQRLSPKAIRQLVKIFPQRNYFFAKSVSYLEKIFGHWNEKGREALKIFHRQGHPAHPSPEDFVSFRSPLFPENLNALADPPCGIYGRGQWELLRPTQRALGVVGTRFPTRYALHATERLVKVLAPFSPTIVSGMARGIDGQAHRSALEQHLPSIGVLGTPLEQIYPREHRSLFEAMTQSGLLISELPPGTPMMAYHFPQRNRIIAALSDALVVVEAPEKSGALITADFSLELGKEIFVVPGTWDHEKNRGGLKWVQQGAHLLLEPEEVAREMAWAPTKQDSSVRPPREQGTWSAEEAKILSVLMEGALHVDKIAELGQIPAPRLLGLLSQMALKGVVFELPGKQYEINSNFSKLAGRVKTQ